METLNTYWALVLEIWTNGVYGVDIGHILAGVLVFALLILLRGVFTRVVIGRLQKLAAKTTTTIDDEVLEAMHGPISFIPVTLGFFLGTALLEVSPEADEFLGKVNRSLIAFTIFWALYRATGPVAALLNRADSYLTEAMILWLSKAIHAAFIILGAATILELWGIQVGPLIAGLGLFGVAVALGAQDLFKNLIAGLFLIGEKRFHPGDWILVEGTVEGTVEQIGFRTTKVRRFDKAPVYVPNSILSDNTVTNFTRMTYRRIKWVIGVRYDASSDQLTQVRDDISRYLAESEEFVTPSETATFVRIDQFGASSIDILIYCFTRTTNWLDWLEIKERFLLKIKDIVADAGTDFAYPSQSLYIETMGDVGAQSVLPTSHPAPETYS